MSGRSLRLRLLLAAAISVSLALVLAGFGLVALFDRHVERRVNAELHTFVNQIAAGVDFAVGGLPQLNRPLADPRFERPYGGLYWQIVDEAGDAQRSRSLWDYVLQLPAPAEESGRPQRYEIAGPQGKMLHVYERRIVFPAASGERTLRIVVAVDQHELDNARDEFVEDIAPALIILALVLVAAAWVQVNVGLKPLEAVRQGVAAIRTQRARRLEPDFPDEIMPLVNEVNELLDAQDRTVERARMRAADLAHGLKTPLTVLANDAEKLRRKGEGDMAREIEELVRAMQRHVDHELARVRVAAHSRRQAAAADLGKVLRGIVETIRRTPQGEKLSWEVSGAETSAIVAVDAHDLAEMLGNLVDNAAKWASGHVAIRIGREGGMAVATIRDDGPGVPAAATEALGRRGLRLDEAVAGTGLGLAIVRELLDAYGGSLTLANAPEGGLVAEMRLPAAAGR
ncbi:sensor histidine kinase [Dongia sp.]|jgi:signal transduction histidine kinase|uniref:sensor histidine kinase n=1 Tax=Dongia sp. TaxID=1977262 RepID=UPI0035B07547